jgi:hypothetical protein
MKHFILLMLLLTVYSCGLYRPSFIKTDSGRQAIREAYRLGNNESKLNISIDTTFVYQCENVYVTTNKRGELIRGEHISFSFMRFSNKGLAYTQSFIEETPTDADYDSLEKGQYCFYIIEKDILKVEIYNFDTNMFEYQYGRIQENGDILFFKREGRPWWAYKGKLNNLYRKTAANLKVSLVFPSR